MARRPKSEIPEKEVQPSDSGGVEAALRRLEASEPPDADEDAEVSDEEIFAAFDGPPRVLPEDEGGENYQEDPNLSYHI